MQVIDTKNAPGAIGPYSQGFKVGGFVYTSGQIPVDPATGNAPEGIAAQAEQSCKNVAAILEAAPWVRERDVPLILQPMSSMAELRGWLQANGFCIEEERLAKEGDTLYTALLVRAGEMPPLSPAELWAGKNNSDPLRGEWLDMWIARTGRALEGMAQGRGEEVLSRRKALEEVREGLFDMKKEWELWQR